MLDMAGRAVRRRLGVEAEYDPSATSTTVRRYHLEADWTDMVLGGEFMYALAPMDLCSMSGLSFAPISKTEEAKAYRTLISAFTYDPVERWLYPELPEYLTHFPQFLAAFGGRAFDEQTVWGLGECSAVALWLPAGAEPDGDAIASVLTETVSRDKHDATFAVLEQMDMAHPTYPHWYLPWFGVDTALQGKELGGELMDHCLEIVDTSSSARLPRDPESTQSLLLRASWVRGHGRCTSGGMSTDHLHGEVRQNVQIELVACGVRHATRSKTLNSRVFSGSTPSTPEFLNLGGCRVQSRIADGVRRRRRSEAARAAVASSWACPPTRSLLSTRSSAGGT